MGQRDGDGDGSQSSASGPIRQTYLPHPYQSLNADGEIEFVNDAWIELLGYDRETVLGEAFPSVLDDQSRDRFEEKFQQFKDQGHVSDVKLGLVGPNGLHHQVAFDGRIEYAEDGSVRRTHCQFKDIRRVVEQDRKLDVYRQIVEGSTDLLAAADRDHALLIANERYRQFHGIKSAEPIVGKHLREVFDEEFYAAVKPHIDRALDGEMVSYEMARRNAAGEERILDIEYVPLRTDSGSITGAVAVMRDVTEERERIESIRQLSEYRNVLSSVNHWLVRTNNPREALERITETIESSYLFNCAFFVLLEDFAPSFVCSGESDLDEADVRSFHTEGYLERVFEEGLLRIEDVTAPPFNQHSDPRPSHAGVALAVTHDGTEYGVLTVHLPPEHRLEEVEIRLLTQLAEDVGLFLHSQSVEQNYRTFKEIAERIGDPIMLQNLEGEFEAINGAVSEYADRARDALLGEDEFAFMDESVARTIAEKKSQVVETEEPVRYEVTPTLPMKGERTFSTIRYPHYDESGHLDGTVAICRDVTDLKERERHLQVMDRVLRHNVNNDMTVIEGFAETIRANTDDDPSAEQAQKIVDHSRRLTGIVEKERKITSLLADPVESRPIDLVPIVMTAVGKVKAEHDAFDITCDLPEACAVRGAESLGQAIEELLANAVNHSDREVPSLTVEMASAGSVVELRVADDGPTIPEMERAVLTGEGESDPLFHGSGLGLWLVNLIVRQVDGTLEFSRNDPRGNVVIVRLPAA